MNPMHAALSELINSSALSQYKLNKLFSGLFPQQRDFIFDPSKRKAAICSRRAGKSTAGGAYLVKEVLTGVEGDVAYIGLTRGAAKKVMFQPLLRMNQKYNLGLEFNRSELTATTPRGDTIYMTGAHTEDDTEKLRGLKFKLILLDECASFKAHLNYLIEEVLEPTLIDTDGTLALIGTPSANPGSNYFHKATQDPSEGYGVHKWTILNNPYIPHAGKWLADYKKRKGWDDDHPIYRREWLGEWTTDGDSLVYKYKKDRNDYETLPALKFQYVIGCDIGYNDAFTICVLAYCEDTRNVYVVHEYRKSGLIPAQMAEQIRIVQEKYKPISIVADHGGLGKAICEEFRARYHLPIKPAEKSQKRMNIELMNGDLISGLLKIKYDSHLAKEMMMLQWDADRPGKEDERTPNDLCDSALYSFREAKHYLGEDKPEPPEFGTDSYWNLEAKKMLDAELEAANNETQESWWAK